MGLQDVFFQLRLPFDGEEARKLSCRIQEEIYFHALDRIVRAGAITGQASQLSKRPVPPKACCNSIFGT